MPLVLIELWIEANINGNMTLHTFLFLLGGPTIVGRKLGIRPQAVSLWVLNKRVPAARVPALIRMARERGVDISPAMLRSDIDWSGLA